MSVTNEDLVFLSYAREDQSWAERLYMDLRKQSINVWLDIRCLKPGSDWKFEIKRAIRHSRQVILLMSKHSVNKRGFIQREIRDAIDTLKEIPKGEIFLIPVRLDETRPIDDELHALNWVSLLPDYHDGLGRILSVLAENRLTPVTVYTAAPASSSPTTPVKFVDKGRETTISVPLIIGDRAAIRYAPFRSAKEFLQQFLDRLPTDRIYADHSIAYYFTIDCLNPDLIIGDDLRRQYPEQITIVLRRAYSDLQVRENGFSVEVAFGDEIRNIAVPFDAIKVIDIPQLGINIRIGKPTLPLGDVASLRATTSSDEGRTMNYEGLDCAASRRGDVN